MSWLSFLKSWSNRFYLESDETWCYILDHWNFINNKSENFSLHLNFLLVLYFDSSEITSGKGIALGISHKKITNSPNLVANNKMFQVSYFVPCFNLWARCFKPAVFRESWSIRFCGETWKSERSILDHWNFINNLSEY